MSLGLKDSCLNILCGYVGAAKSFAIKACGDSEGFHWPWRFPPAAKGNVPMPNVCLEFGVEYCNVFDMLQELKVKFVLRTKHGAT
jgi:hypothetical protein